VKKWAIMGADILLSDYSVAPGHMVLIENGTIVGIFPPKQNVVDLSGFTCINAAGYLLIPGLINAHTHAPMGFFRGYGHGHAQMIENFLFPAEKALTPSLTEPLSYSYLWGALASGCTHLVDHYYFSEGVGRAMERLGLRATLGECVADLGGAFPGRDAWDRAKALLERWPFSRRITPCIAPHAADTVSMDLLSEMAEFAGRSGLPLHMHLSQTQGEWERVMARSGLSPVEYAAKAGALTDRTLAVHLVSASPRDIDLLLAHGVTAVICPQSEVIYERLPPLAMMVEKGLSIAVATDCAASDDSADMFAEMKFMAMTMRMLGKPLAASHILAMGLEKARLPLGLTVPGGIAVGAVADLVCIRQSVDILPMEMAAENLVYSVGSRHVRHVMIDGEWVVWQQQPVKISHQEMAEAYQEALAHLPRLPS
jgi:5-methylthioadenosine/S-adenosylhomocysteine deaminase